MEQVADIRFHIRRLTECGRRKTGAGQDETNTPARH
jgi:hypothetical protein